MNEDDQNPQKRRKLNDGDEDNDEEDKKEADVDCFTNVDEIGKLCYQAYCKLGSTFGRLEFADSLTTFLLLHQANQVNQTKESTLC